jgi:hypothetical protein
MAKPAGVVMVALMAAACGPPDPPPTPEETVFGDQVKALEKARSVEDKTEARKRELDERMKQAEDGG